MQDSIVNQLELYPQEKIYLHTDRSMYVPGELLWFKVYVVDAFSHQWPTYSQYAYIELISSSDLLIHRVMVSHDEFGLFHGHIFLSENIPEGDYTLRAYTRYMVNMGNDYFFKKHIRINRLKAETTPDSKQAEDNNDYEVSFYPEGGYLTEGALCRLAFKALKSNGASEFITGEIMDNAGNIISTVSTFYDGMGSIYFIPKTNAVYYLYCKNQSGQEKRFKLPGAQKISALSVVNQRNRIFVEINKSPDIPEQPLFLFVHCRGTVLYFAPWDHSKRFILFSRDMLPSGILQVVLFNVTMNPVSERLVFNINDDQAKSEFSLDKSFYQMREKVSAEISVTDPEGNPVEGNLSVSVTDDRDVGADMLNTITAGLLLSSELKGTIESPGYYLQDNDYSAFALDLLMMTNGWRRYDISEAVKGNYSIPAVGFEVMKEISGSVKRPLFGRSIAKSEVLIIADDGDYAQVETDASGSFSLFAHFPDSSLFMVQAKNQRGMPNVELMLNREIFPAWKYVPKSPLLSPFVNQSTVDAADLIIKAARRAQYDEEMRLIHLPEVVVSAKKIEKKDEARLSTWVNSSSDATIYREDIEKRNPKEVTEMLSTVAGVRVFSNGNVSIRESAAPPLILVDGLPYDYLLNDLSIYDIETIDVFKGPGAAIFGGRGNFGAISITLRKGPSYTPTTPIINFATYEPLGYQQPVEFYSPKYDTPESKNHAQPDYRTTIFWKPDLLISTDGKATFNFYTSDFPTTYSVVIEGMSNDGRIIRHVETIEVK